MSYKTILVSLNEIGRLPQLLAATIKIGKSIGAHVSGLYVVPAVQVYPSVGFEAAPQVFEGNRSFFKDHAVKVREQFEAAMTREGSTIVNGNMVDMAAYKKAIDEGAAAMRAAMKKQGTTQ